MQKTHVFLCHRPSPTYLGQNILLFPNVFNAAMNDFTKKSTQYLKITPISLFLSISTNKNGFIEIVLKDHCVQGAVGTRHFSQFVP